MPLRNWQEMLNEAEKSGPIDFKPLEPGEYDFVIEKAEYRQSQKQKDGYNITASVESGPHQNRKVFNTFWVSPESPTAMSIFFRQMNVLGLDSNFWNSNPSDDQICAALVGKRFIGTVKKSEYNGKERNEISNVATPRPAPAGAGPVVPGGGSVPTPPTPQAPAPAPAAPQAPAPVPAPTPQAQAQAAPAAPASPWDSQPAPAEVPTNDPWASSAPPAPPVPGA